MQTNSSKYFKVLPHIDDNYIDSVLDVSKVRYNENEEATVDLAKSVDAYKQRIKEIEKELIEFQHALQVKKLAAMTDPAFIHRHRFHTDKKENLLIKANLLRLYQDALIKLQRSEILLEAVRE